MTGVTADAEVDDGETFSVYDITLGEEGTINNEANGVANRILRTRQRIFLLFSLALGSVFLLF